MPAYRNKTGRNRGKRFQGPGWRDTCGSLYFQLKRDTFSRCHGVLPNKTMDDLISSLEHELSQEDNYPPLAEGLEFAFFLRKQRLERSDERAFRIFDGGETVYVKIVDEYDGTEYVQSYGENMTGSRRFGVGSRNMKMLLRDMVLGRHIEYADNLITRIEVFQPENNSILKSIRALVAPASLEPNSKDYSCGSEV